MGIFDLFKQNGLKETIFLKETNSAEAQLSALNSLLSQTENSEIKDKISQEIKMVQAGIAGENNVAYELKSSMLPMYVFHDLFLEYNGLTAQIDYLVIHKHFILVIESKRMIGDIEINQKGDFIRSFKSENGKVYKKEGIYSPIVQNERHTEILKNILLQKFTKSKRALWDEVIKSVVVISNQKSIVNDKYAKKEIKNQIIKYDQLKNYLLKLEKDNKEKTYLPNDSMQKIADALLELNKENPIDYTEKYKSLITANEQNQSHSVDSIEQTPIYIELKSYRYKKSLQEQIKPYFIYNNAQLEQIISIMPKSINDLMRVNGFAEVKCQKYGQDIIDIVKKYL